MRTIRLMRALFLMALAAGCSSSTTGGTGGTSGTGGSGTGGTGGGGGTPGNADSAAPTPDGGGTFKAVLPCSAATDYQSGSMITFPVSASQLRYSPQCLKVTTGATVTFNGDFTMHPLRPSMNRPNTDTPITAVDSGASKTFTFTKAGFYAFYCQFHDPIDTGTLMSGVIWVTP